MRGLDSLEVFNMDKVCRWCKHYKNGCCTRDNFTVNDKETWYDVTDEVDLTIKEPDKFYCSNWE